MNKAQEAEKILYKYADAELSIREMGKQLSALGYDKTTYDEEVAYQGTTPNYEKREGSTGNKTGDPTARKAEILMSAKDQRIHNLLTAIQSICDLRLRVDAAMFALPSEAVAILRMKYQEDRETCYICGALHIKKWTFYRKHRQALECFYDEYVKE